MKMYNAEVLSKFPVVQHFPFGALFAWEKDPNAQSIQASVHTSSQPKSSTVPSSTSSTSSYASARPQPQQHLRDPKAEPGTQLARSVGTAAPWIKSESGTQLPLRDPMAGSTVTAAPWAKPGGTARSAAGPNVPSGPNQPTRAPWASRTPAPPPPVGGGGAGTTAPWARRNVKKEEEQEEQEDEEEEAGMSEPMMEAPWAEKKL